MTRAMIQRPGSGATTIDGGALLEPVRRRYEPHAPGVLYFVITVFLAIGAINSQNNLLFLAFGLAMAGLLISGLISGPPLMHIVARRLAPGPAHVGETAEIRYAVASRGGFIAAMGLEIRELSGPEAPSSFAPGAILHLRPGTDRTAIAVVTPTRRGRHTLTGFSVSSAFPFGLLRKTLVFEQPHAWVVAPRRVPLREIPWRKAGREGATLSATAARRGVSTEFYALRAYVPGDPTRQIAWRPSARVGELVVREQAASAPPKIWIRIDHPDEQTPAHLVERGAALVAALAQDATQAGFAVGLTGHGINPLRPLSGSRQVRAIQVAMGVLGEPGMRDDQTRDPPMNERGTLRVRVQFRGSPGRSSGGSEFRISAEEVGRWYAGETLPPEFEPASEGGDATRGGWLTRGLRLLRGKGPRERGTGGAP
jgi:uncharacterized protein (DUF58 family)